MERLYLVKLATDDDYGVYSDRRRGMFNTSLVYRGTLAACRRYIKEH